MTEVNSFGQTINRSFCLGSSTSLSHHENVWYILNCSHSRTRATALMVCFSCSFLFKLFLLSSCQVKLTSADNCAEVLPQSIFTADDCHCFVRRDSLGNSQHKPNTWHVRSRLKLRVKGSPLFVICWVGTRLVCLGRDFLKVEFTESEGERGSV